MLIIIALMFVTLAITSIGLYLEPKETPTHRHDPKSCHLCISLAPYDVADAGDDVQWLAAYAGFGIVREEY